MYRRARPATPDPHLVSFRFLTWTRTVGQGEHVDVSLWFLVVVDEDAPLAWDAREFTGVRWVARS